MSWPASRSRAGRPCRRPEPRPLHGLRVFELTPGTGMVVYEATAEREGDPPYSALMSSLYIRRPDGWKLAVHQQAPR